MRDYIGVDWADTEDAVHVLDEAGGKVLGQTVAHTALALSRGARRRHAAGREAGSVA